MFWRMILNLNRGGMGQLPISAADASRGSGQAVCNLKWRNSWSIRILELKVISLHVGIIYSCIENGFYRG